MESNHTRILTAREAGYVRRCHTIPIIGEYTVGKHCYDALSILLILHPEPSLNLIKAVLWHDVAERWTGDTPAPAKWSNPDLNFHLREMENRILRLRGFKFELTAEEECWLRGVDMLEFLMFAYEQIQMGNKCMSAYFHKARNVFISAPHHYPTICFEIAITWSPERLEELEP